jgi:glycosyltransferase involved in cell wall biosynthesis
MGKEARTELRNNGQPAVDQCDRPLVTFALFAYNQEKYIREAVEGAFSQTYEPLEIIMSDDCSTDRTFEVMKEMADAYVGLHKVQARKTAENRGVLGHLLEVAHLAAGELIVLAAGDDVSKAGRVSEIVRVWTETDAWALHSRYDIIDAKGRVTARNTRSEDLFAEDCELRRYFYSADGEVYVIHGATSAYRRDFFGLLPKEYPDGILSEDGVLSVYLNAHRKRAEFIEDSLILYRRHDAAITNHNREGQVRLSAHYRLIKKQQVYSQNILQRAILFKNCIAARSDLRPLNERQLQRDIIFYSAVTASLFARLRYFGRATIIGFAEGKLGSLIPGVLGTSLAAFYLFLRHNALIQISGFRRWREASSR